MQKHGYSYDKISLIKIYRMGREDGRTGQGPGFQELAGMKTFGGMTLVAAAALGLAGCSGKHEAGGDNISVVDNGSSDGALGEDNLTATDGALGVDNLDDNAAITDLNSSGELSNATENTAG